MAQNIISIVSPTDRSLISFLRSLYEKDLINQVSLNLGPYISFASTNIEKFDADVESIPSLDGKLVLVANFKSQSEMTYVFHRSVLQGNTRIPSLYEGEIEITARQQPTRDDVALKILAETTTHFKQTVDPISADAQVNSALSSQTERMFSVATGISEKLAAAQLEYDLKFNQQIDKLETEHEQREARQQKNYEGKKVELETLKREIEAKESELNLKSAQHERRSIRDEMTTDVKARVKNSAPSKGIRNYRIVIILFCCFAIFVSGGVALESVSALKNTSLDLASLNAPLIGILTRSFLSLFVMIGFILFILNYLKKIASEETIYERNLERFMLDLNRASWIVETVVDLQKNENSPVPDEWLTAATYGMFQPIDATKVPDETPIEALASLLSVGAKMKLGASGAELELDKKASKKVAKSSE